MLFFDMLVLFGLEAVLISGISGLVAVRAAYFLALGGICVAVFAFVRVLFSLLAGLSRVVCTYGLRTFIGNRYA